MVRTFSVLSAVLVLIGATAAFADPVIGPPTDKSQCMHGGWKTFNNPTFANQSECMKYTNKRISSATPSILDTLPVTYQTISAANGISFNYTVPTGGTNKELVVQFCLGGERPPTVTQNGVNVPLTLISNDSERCYHWYGVLANPTSGTFSLTWTGSDGGVQVSVMTLQDVDQTSPIDASNVTFVHPPTHASTISTSVTTTQANDLLLDEAVGSIPGTVQTYGAGQTETHPGSNSDPAGQESGSYKIGGSAGLETMTRYFSPDDGGLDLAVIAVKGI